MRTFNTVLLFFAVMGVCCKPEPLGPEESEPCILSYSVEGLLVDSSFSLCEECGGELLAPGLVEASGAAASRRTSNAFWSHNDSGHPNVLFLVNLSGELLLKLSLTGAGSRDYEDMCIGQGPDDEHPYIYLGDIGDNQAVHDYIVIYRFPEPVFALTEGTAMNTSLQEGELERFELVYPDGPRDAETLMFDPLSGDLFVVSKRDFRSRIYKCNSAQLSLTSRTELEFVAQLPFNYAVAGDISPTGQRIAIKDYDCIYAWERIPGESVVEALKRQPVELPYILEPQGESFAWLADESGYLTVSEQSGVYPPDVYIYLSTND
jgi:hypothetical protein